jgi:hypothetical protein
MRSMSRGKQQVLFNYLPGRTIDFERAVIAKIETIRGTAVSNLNPAMVLLRVAEEARAWNADFRPVLRDDVLRDASRFVLVDAEDVRARLYPEVFWCQNRSCGIVQDRTGRGAPQATRCPVCGNGRLAQLRFVKVHRCGALSPLTPPSCRRCGNAQRMALDTRGSERISNFRWVCRRCNVAQSFFGGRCPECQWKGDPKLRNMDTEVHRAGRTYYAHTVVLLNTPGRELSSFLSLDGWSAIAAAKHLGLSEVVGRPLSSFVPTAVQPTSSDATLSGGEVDELLARQAQGELAPEQMVRELSALLARRRQEQAANSPNAILRSLVAKTGLAAPYWDECGQEMLEAVLPFEFGNAAGGRGVSSDDSSEWLDRLRLREAYLFSDFPIVTATYGFSRVAYTPNDCRLNAFPADRNFTGRLPIYVDRVRGDAISLQLEPESVLRWLMANGVLVSLPGGSDPSLAAKAYFVRLFAGANLRQTIQNNDEVRLVFTLLHTIAHLAVRQAALLCGLDVTSISEYLLPRSLSVSIYCNHRFGATIGALTALFEQSRTEWLRSIWSQRQCIYDPVCREREGSCHACLHLAETSCRYFNLNLNRAALFGGVDPVLGRAVTGYLDPAVGGS